MSKLLSGASLLAGALVGGPALAAPLDIDSEAKANLAASVAIQQMQASDAQFHGVVDSARGVIYQALSTLHATTTPAALLRSRDGLSIPCATAGDLLVRLSRSLPRQLKLEWRTCKDNDVNGYPHERSGQAEVLLFGDSFTPDRVASIRLGTASADYTDRRYIVDESQGSPMIFDDTYRSNLRLVGLIPMKRAFPPNGFYIGDFLFEATGYLAVDSRFENPASGWPPFHQISTSNLDHVFASGSRSYNDDSTAMKIDLTLHWGTFSREAQSESFPSVKQGFSVEGLRVRQEWDYAAWRFAWRLDGKVNLAPSEPADALTCRPGDYVFKTLAPLTGSLDDYGLLDGGDLLVNRRARLRFHSAATTPPGFPAPVNGLLARVDVAGVGSFAYDMYYSGEFSDRAGCN
jgi:hypothetical protein